MTIFRDTRDYPEPDIHLLFKIEDYVAPRPERRDVGVDQHRVRNVEVRDHGRSILRVHEFRMGGEKFGVHGGVKL